MEVKLVSFLRRYYLVTALFITTHVSSAQALEIGGGLGTSYATGDMTRGFELGELGLAGQLFIRYNLSNVVSVRGTGLFAQLYGDDNTHPIDPFAEKRGFDFHRANYEMSAVVEYNFLDYKERKSMVNFSPYFFIGGGLSAVSNRKVADDYSRIQPVIPIGIGMKYRLTKQWNLEFEFGARKTFYDGLDRLSGTSNPNKLKPNYGNELDNDWYYYAGISVSYTFYSIPCPFNSY